MSFATAIGSEVLLPLRQRFRVSTRVLRYGSALGSVVIATLIRFLLAPYLGHHSAFLLLLPAILFSSWYGGLGPGLVAVGVGALLSTWLFLSSQTGLVDLDSTEILALLLYVLAGLAVTLMSMAQREAQNYARASAVIATVQREEISRLNQRLSQSVVEANHRIKNNLQVVSSLLGLTTSDTQSKVDHVAIERIRRHVDTLSVLHDLLTMKAKVSPGIDTISLEAILGKLVPMLQATAGGATIIYNAEVANVPSKKGISLSLLLNELISNAIKHGADKIHITVTVTGTMVHLVVYDDGPGFPPDFDAGSAAHTGLELVQTIAEHDLGGEVVYENRPEGGARVSVSFPVGSTVTL